MAVVLAIYELLRVHADLDLPPSSLLLPSPSPSPSSDLPFTPFPFHRSTPIPESPTRPCPSSTPSSTISSSESRPRLPSSLLTTRSPPSLPERSRPLSGKPCLFLLFPTLILFFVASLDLFPRRDELTSFLAPSFLPPSSRLILPGELSKHAISEGTKSVTKFSSSSK